MTTAIILAAGKSSRMGTAIDKTFLSLVDKPVIAWSLLAFEKCAAIDRIIISARKDKLLAMKEVVKRYGISKLDKIVVGGSRRQDSVAEALAVCDPDTRYVVIHDAARPCVTDEMITSVLEVARRLPAATLGHPVIDTLKHCERGSIISETLPREHLWQVQTPQAFQLKALREAYKALKEKHEITDDCQAVELLGEQIKIVEYSEPNLKLTTPRDIHILSKLLK